MEISLPYQELFRVPHKNDYKMKTLTDSLSFLWSFSWKQTRIWLTTQDWRFKSGTQWNVQGWCTDTFHDKHIVKITYCIWWKPNMINAAQARRHLTCQRWKLTFNKKNTSGLTPYTYCTEKPVVFVTNLPLVCRLKYYQTLYWNILQGSAKIL